jgi:hypothetical protein
METQRRKSASLFLIRFLVSFFHVHRARALLYNWSPVRVSEVMCAALDRPTRMRQWIGYVLPKWCYDPCLMKCSVWAKLVGRWQSCQRMTGSQRSIAGWCCVVVPLMASVMWKDDGVAGKKYFQRTWRRWKKWYETVRRYTRVLIFYSQNLSPSAILRLSY